MEGSLLVRRLRTKLVSVSNRRRRAGSRAGDEDILDRSHQLRHIDGSEWCAYWAGGHQEQMVSRWGPNLVALDGEREVRSEGASYVSAAIHSPPVLFPSVGSTMRRAEYIVVNPCFPNPSITPFKEREVDGRSSRER